MALSALIGAACALAPPAPAKDRGDGSYTVLEALPVFTLDPARMTWDHDLRLGNALFDGLVRWDPQTFDIEPGVAERWDVSPDGLTWTFHLREAARWSNGEPITASDFIFSWRRLLTPDTAGDYSNLLFVIRGGEEFFRWREEALRAYAAKPEQGRTAEAAEALHRETDAKFVSTVGLAAPDARTLRVTLARPTPLFLDTCAFVPLFAVHPASVAACAKINPATGRIEQGHEWTKPPRLISSGAYTLARWRFRQDMLLARNERSWEVSRIRAASVTVRVIEDPNTRALTFQTGGGDWNTDLLVDYLPDMLREAARSGGGSGATPTTHAYQRFGTYFWSFNCRERLANGRDNPFADANVRRAFALATDRQTLADAIRGLGEQIAGTLIPPGSIRGYDEERTVRGPMFDPDRARRALAEAGWARDPSSGRLVDSSGAGRGEFPAVDLLTPGGSYHERIALALGAGWERELGARFRISVKDSRSVKQNLRSGDFMLARGAWFGDFEDPGAFLSIHRSGDGNNDRGYSNPEFDRLFDRAEAETNRAVRLRRFAEAERFVSANDVPILTLWRFNHFYQFDPTRLHGVSAHPRMMQRFDRIWLEPTEGRADAGAKGAAP